MDTHRLAIVLASNAENAMKLVVTALKHNNLTLAIKAVANAQTELDAVQAILEKLQANDRQDIEVLE
ncbi:MAG TPA: hypothetical protein VFR47_12210 [Anaerolineales bacterium]|nr:hypothetical protein [Anaerolineales bacterium]